MTFSEYFNNNENYFWLTLNLSNKKNELSDITYVNYLNSIPWLEFDDLGEINNSYLKLMLFHSKDRINKFLKENGKIWNININKNEIRKNMNEYLNYSNEKIQYILKKSHSYSTIYQHDIYLRDILCFKNELYSYLWNSVESKKECLEKIDFSFLIINFNKLVISKKNNKKSIKKSINEIIQNNVDKQNWREDISNFVFELIDVISNNAIVISKDNLFNIFSKIDIQQNSTTTIEKCYNRINNISHNLSLFILNNYEEEVYNKILKLVEEKFEQSKCYIEELYESGKTIKTLAFGQKDYDYLNSLSNEALWNIVNHPNFCFLNTNSLFLFFIVEHSEKIIKNIILIYCVDILFRRIMIPNEVKNIHFFLDNFDSHIEAFVFDNNNLSLKEQAKFKSDYKNTKNIMDIWKNEKQIPNWVIELLNCFQGKQEEFFSEKGSKSINSAFKHNKKKFLNYSEKNTITIHIMKLFYITIIRNKEFLFNETILQNLNEDIRTKCNEIMFRPLEGLWRKP